MKLAVQLVAMTGFARAMLHFKPDLNTVRV